MTWAEQFRTLRASGLSEEQALAAIEGMERGAKPKRKAAVERAARAHTLPEDWWPDEGLREFARAELGNGTLCHRETEKFKDHWKQAAGANSRKSDWAAAYRNWIRRAAERLPHRSGNILPSARQNGSDALKNALDTLVPRR